MELIPLNRSRDLLRDGGLNVSCDLGLLYDGPRFAGGTGGPLSPGYCECLLVGPASGGPIPYQGELYPGGCLSAGPAPGILNDLSDMWNPG